MGVTSLYTDDIRVAAALVAQGNTLRGGRRHDSKLNIVEFEVWVRDENLLAAQDLIAHCDRVNFSYEIEVHLGRYEQAMKEVRRVITLIAPKEENTNGPTRRLVSSR